MKTKQAPSMQRPKRERIPDVELETLIRRRSRLEIELALEVVNQVAAGLTAIHKKHLVHRDIKPSNIMLSWEEDRLENVKIMDLGLAKGVTEDTLSIAGSFIGTPVYASPEQFADETRERLNAKVQKSLQLSQPLRSRTRTTEAEFSPSSQPPTANRQPQTRAAVPLGR
jgi:serine/threonine protein kinase